MFRRGDAARRDFIREHVMAGCHRLTVGLGEPNSGSGAEAPRTAAAAHRRRGSRRPLPRTADRRRPPGTRKAAPRDALACAGVQRVVSLGRAGDMPPGLSHDGFHPLQRLMRWVNEE
ncbi:acyl-CoA reductase [Streptomyces mirabilis]|uniref:acyl-CoA reductase n=1 Tax=Streptomyces mirabilis TaxID=68239 RepID=UPI0033B68612